MDELINALKVISEGYLRSDKALLNLIEEVIKQHNDMSQVVNRIVDVVNIQSERIDRLEDSHKTDAVSKQRIYDA